MALLQLRRGQLRIVAPKWCVAVGAMKGDFSVRGGNQDPVALNELLGVDHPGLGATK